MMLRFCFNLVILLISCRLSLAFKDDDYYDTDDDKINRLVKLSRAFKLSLILTTLI